MYHTDKALLWLHDVQASCRRTSARRDEQRIVKAAGAEERGRLLRHLPVGNGTGPH